MKTIRTIYKYPVQLLHALAALVTVGVFVLSIFAQPAASPDMSTSIWQGLQWILITAAVATILGNVAWSFFNRRSYDKLKEIIGEQNELIASHEKRHSNLKLIAAEVETRLQCEIQALKTEAQRLAVNNQAVVSQNLQMKAILKQQRLAGQWQGHEEEIFQRER